MKRSKRNPGFSANLLLVLKTAVLCCIVTALLVLILAVTMRWNWISSEGIRPVNTAIKAISACLAGFLLYRQRPRLSWLIAGLTGMLYMALAFAVFGILNGSFSVTTRTISDLLMAFACGSCVSILTGMLSGGQGKKKETFHAGQPRQTPGRPAGTEEH